MAERTAEEIDADIARVQDELGGNPNGFRAQQELLALEAEKAALAPAPAPAAKAAK